MKKSNNPIYIIGEEHVTLRGAERTLDFIRKRKGTSPSLILIEFAKNKRNTDAAARLESNDIEFLSKKYGKQLKPHFARLLRGYSRFNNANVIPIDMSAAKTQEHEKFVKEMKVAFRYLKEFNKLTARPGSKKISELGASFLEKETMEKQLRLFSLHLLHLIKGQLIREKVIVDNVENEMRKDDNWDKNIFLIAGANHTVTFDKLLRQRGYSVKVKYADYNWIKVLGKLPIIVDSASRYLEGDHSEKNPIKLIQLIFAWFEWPNTKDVDKLIDWAEKFKASKDLPNTIEEARKYHEFMINSMEKFVN